MEDSDCGYGCDFYALDCLPNAHHSVDGEVKHFGGDMIKVYICWKWVDDAVAHYSKEVPYKCIVKGATKEENKKIHCLFSLMGDDSFYVNDVFGYIPDKDKKYASFENFGWFLHDVFSVMHDWYLTWLDHGANAFWKLAFEKLRKKEKSETVYYLEEA